MVDCDIVNGQIFQRSLAKEVWGTRRRLNHAAHNSFCLRQHRVKCQPIAALRSTTQPGEALPVHGLSCFFPVPPTSVGRLISNRSSRLAFQWLMMSASFLLSSSLLPDMVDSLPNALRRAVLGDKTSPKVSPQQKDPAAQKLKVQIGTFVARTDWFVSAHRPAV